MILQMSRFRSCRGVPQSPAFTGKPRGFPDRNRTEHGISEPPNWRKQALDLRPRRVFSDDNQLDRGASALQAFSNVSDHVPRGCPHCDTSLGRGLAGAGRGRLGEALDGEVTADEVADVAASARAARRAAVAGGSGGSPYVAA
jgi:hypothetical protein